MPGQHDFDPNVDLYQVLQVDPKARPELIKSAYRTLMRASRLHPDLGGDEKQAVLINRAYEVLSDPDRRREYDAFRAAHQPRVFSSRSETRPSWPGTGGRTAPRRPSPAPAPAERRPPLVNNHLRLNPALYAELSRDSELKLRSTRRPRGGRCVCRRCNYAWPAPRAGIVPRTCPKCKSPDWNSFRVFKCSQCGYEFTTNSLRAWAYRLYPRCPACQARKWNLRCERDPLKWLKGLFAGV